MEGLPRISMISIDLKESNETPDLSILYKYIESHYDERSSNYRESFKEFLTLRQTSINGNEDLPYLTNMKRYFCQLQLLKQRFPLSKEGECPVTWSWEDSHSNSTVCINDIRLEEAAIQYNIACLHCNLGAGEKRIDLDSTKIACTHFQCAAWAFQSVLEQYTPLPSADLECDVLRYLNLLMLAQAHECVLEKSMVDQRRAGISSKIAFQISDLYKQCQGLLQSENIGYSVNSKQYKLWKRTCSLKEFLYHCLSYYYMALGAEDAHKYGEIIAWLKLAKDKLEKCNKPLKELKSSEAEETIKFIQDVVNGKFESAKKDNDFIYYDKVPEPEMLPPIKGAMLLKGIGFDIHDPEICGQDIFKNLIPMETHISSSIYSEKKAEILRNIQTDIEAKTTEIDQFLIDIHWSYATFTLEDSKVPQDLFNCAAFITANPDELTNIKRTMQDISSISIEVEESLELLSTAMRTETIDKNSSKYKGFEKEYKEFISNFEDAKESNNQLREAFSCTFNDFKCISEPIEQVINNLPSLKTVSENEEIVKSLEECRRLIGKIEEMKSQRHDLLEQLKSNMMSDDPTQLLLGCKTESEQSKAIEECLKKYDQTLGYLRQNLSAQTNIIEAVVEHNAKIVDLNTKIIEIKNERETFINRVIHSFKMYKSLLNKGEEGIDFYRKLGIKILKLQKGVDSLIPTPLPKPIINDNIKIEKTQEIKKIPDIPEKLPISSNAERESNYEFYSFPTLPSTSTTPRLKDYLKERKSRHSIADSPSARNVSDSIQEKTPQSVLNTNQYPYMPWGYYGPPSQGIYNPNYAVSRPRDHDSEFRITQNIQLPAASSEVGCSVYPNYSSLPRPSYSQPSSSSMTCNLAASIDNLASSTGFPINQFTIPYQQQPFYNPNVISMAHSFGTRSSIPLQESHLSNVHPSDPYQYYHNANLDINNFQYQNKLPSQSMHFHQTQLSNQSIHSNQTQLPSQNIYPNQNLQPNQNINPNQTQLLNQGMDPDQTHLSSQTIYSNQNLQHNQNILPNQTQLPNQNPSSIFYQNVHYNESVSESSSAAFQQGNYFVQQSQQPSEAASIQSSSQNSQYGNTQMYYNTTNTTTPDMSQNYLNYNTPQNDHQNNHYINTSSSSYQPITPKMNYYDSANSYGNSSISSPQQKDFRKDSLNSFSNRNVSLSKNISIQTKPLNSLVKVQPNTDLLSSSPINILNQEISKAILEPTVLTKQEIEDQKEEKRKQIYRKQSSGANNPLNDNLILNKFISDAERFMKRATEILDTSCSNKSLEQHWTQFINKERMLPKKSSAIAKCSPMKNRMQDSVPYDENRVFIKDGKDDYINASHILLQNIDECLPRFITFQSPMANTVSEYWTAVFEQGCELLVQLAQPCDKNDTSKGRVVSYWPDAKGQFMVIGSKFEISVQSYKERLGWCERILLMKHLKSNQSRSIWHFHVNNVSNKLPKDQDEFLTFMTELCGYYRQQRSLTKPIGISCMNGSSVCGVMILLTATLLIMEITGQFPDVDMILMTMWTQRKNLLDDKHQLAFIYKCVSKASSDMLSKRNIVIGPGRLITSVHSTSLEHSLPPTMIVTQPPSTSILDTIFTTQHLQLSELTSAISKWTVKVDDKLNEINNDKIVPIKLVVDETKSSLIEPVKTQTKKMKEIDLPSSLKHLENPSTIDFTPTPSDKRKITKKEFEQKMDKNYTKPISDNIDIKNDPLKSLDPIYNNQ